MDELRDQTLTYLEFRKWLRTHRQEDGCVHAIIDGCVITGIPKGEVVFDNLKISVEKKILFWTVKRIVDVTMCLGFPMLGSTVSRCVFQAEK